MRRRVDALSRCATPHGVSNRDQPGRRAWPSLCNAFTGGLLGGLVQAASTRQRAAPMTTSMPMAPQASPDAAPALKVQARKEHLTTVFLSKGCKMSDSNDGVPRSAARHQHKRKNGAVRCRFFRAIREISSAPAQTSASSPRPRCSRCRGGRRNPTAARRA